MEMVAEAEKEVVEEEKSDILPVTGTEVEVGGGRRGLTLGPEVAPTAPTGL